jgi:hypothetical protein
VLTSYFPCNAGGKWNTRWNQLQKIIEKYCTAKDFNNLIIACDFNKDIVQNQQFVEELKQFQLKIIEGDYEYSFKLGKKQSKIDYFILSNNLNYIESKSHRSLSDHLQYGT